MFARSFGASSLQILSRSTVPKPIIQSFRNYASQTQGTARSLSKSFLYFSAVGVGAGLVWHFGLRDSDVGKVVEQAKELPPATPAFTGDNQWIDLKLINIQMVTPTTKRFRFALPDENNVSGLKTASCLLTKYKGPNDAKPTIRPYTPVSDEDSRGYIDLLVKKYDQGPMSTHLHSMSTDQRLEFKGPIPKYEWAPNKHEHIALIAGGTGITPMYQLVRAIFKNPDDNTKVTLVYGNRNEDEILLKQEFQDLENTYPQRFKAFYVLDKKPEGSNWANEGYITKELLKTVLPEPGKGNNKIFVCGPPGLYKAISGGKKSPKDQGDLTGYLKELGYSMHEVYKF